MITRRNFCASLAGLVAAPYVIRASGVLMPVADRSLATYYISGHDAWGNRISEAITVPARIAQEIRRTRYKSHRYGELVEPLFQEAFRRGNLADYNPSGFGPFFDGSAEIERGDNFTGFQIIHPSALFAQTG